MRWKIACIIVLLLILIALCVFPIRFMPKPQGIYDVGITEYTFVSDLRNEKYIPKEKPRKLLVRLFYPTASDTCEHPQNGLRKNDVARLINDYNIEKIQVSPRILTNLDYSPLPVCNDAMPFQENFPLVIFTHGLWLSPASNDSLLIALASEGFFVVSIGHTYDAYFTFPDENKSIPFKKNLGSDFYKQINSTGSQDIFKKVSGTGLSQADKQEEYVNLLDSQEIFSARMDYWYDDTIEVIEDLKLSEWQHFIDFQQTIYIGHSLGGAVSGELCAQDSNCRSVIDIDGRPFGQWLTKIDPAKLFYVGSTPNAEEITFIKTIVGPSFEYVIIPRSNHFSLTDYMRCGPVISYIFSQEHKYPNGFHAIFNYAGPVNELNRIVIDQMKKIYSDRMS